MNILESSTCTGTRYDHRGNYATYISLEVGTVSNLQVDQWNDATWFLVTRRFEIVETVVSEDEPTLPPTFVFSTCEGKCDTVSGPPAKGKCDNSEGDNQEGSLLPSCISHLMCVHRGREKRWRKGKGKRDWRRDGGRREGGWGRRGRRGGGLPSFVKYPW